MAPDDVKAASGSSRRRGFRSMRRFRAADGLTMLKTCERAEEGAHVPMRMPTCRSRRAAPRTRRPTPASGLMTPESWNTRAWRPASTPGEDPALEAPGVRIEIVPYVCRTTSAVARSVSGELDTFGRCRPATGSTSGGRVRRSRCDCESTWPPVAQHAVPLDRAPRGNAGKTQGNKPLEVSSGAVIERWWRRSRATSRNIAYAARVLLRERSPEGGAVRDGHPDRQCLGPNAGLPNVRMYLQHIPRHG